MSAINRNDTEDFLGFDIFILLIFYRRRQATREIGREIKAKYIQRNSFLLIDWYSVCVCACVSLYVCVYLIYAFIFARVYIFYTCAFIITYMFTCMCTHAYVSICLHAQKIRASNQSPNNTHSLPDGKKMAQKQKSDFIPPANPDACSY